MPPFTATFIFGLPDDQKVMVQGLNETGNLIYNMEGNAQFSHYVALEPKYKTSCLLTPVDEPSVKVPKADIIVNCITDPDSNSKSLAKAVAVTKYFRQADPGIVIFNDPARIADTSRDRIYQQYHMLPGIYIPRVARVKPMSVADVLASVEAHGIGYPFLIRSCGSHQSMGLQRITCPEEKHLLERYAYDGREYYLTEFVDSRSADGKYRKGRLVCIGKEIYPRHYIMSDIWEVHGNYSKPNMARNVPEEEGAFVQHFRTMLQPQTLATFTEIYKRSGLDFLGFDFAILPDKTALIFEINAVQNPFIYLNPDDTSYLPSVRDNIIAGLNACIWEKMGKVAEVTPTT